MIPAEVETWNIFIDDYPGRFETVDYDFRVGAGMELDEGWADNVKSMATAISQKRIDVLGWNGDQPTIIEIKKRASMSAVGQLLGYKVLFIDEFERLRVPKLMLICQKISRDDRMAFDNEKIPVIEV